MQSELDFVHRTAQLYRRLESDVDLNLVAYTPAEFERLREGGFVGEALRTGRVLYDKKRAGRG